MNTTKTAKLVIALVVLGTATTYLLLQAVKSSWAYYYSVDEFVESNLYTQPQSSDEASGSRNDRIIRLAGWVKEDSIEKSRESTTLDFELTGQKNSVSVTYTGPVPPNFEAGREVVVQGKLSGNKIFKADKIMTRCESKYKVKL
jgi:cytochrome c-type biogenesis protein CcmE